MSEASISAGQVSRAGVVSRPEEVLGRGRVRLRYFAESLFLLAHKNNGLTPPSPHLPSPLATPSENSDARCHAGASRRRESPKPNPPPSPFAAVVADAIETCFHGNGSAARETVNH